MKALVQLERITFRAVLILLLRTALFLCSECDTFLMNYIMSEDGSVVGPYGENESKLFRNVTAADVGITENKGTVKYYGANNQEYIVTYSKSMVTGWYTLAMIPVNVFSKNIATDLTRAIW